MKIKLTDRAKAVILCCVMFVVTLFFLNGKILTPHRIIEQVQYDDSKKATLEEMVSYSTHIVDAKYKGYTVDEYGRAIFLFKPISAVLGSFDEDIIRVSTPEPIDQKCKKGKVYTIFLEKINSVYDEEQEYILLGSRREFMESSDDDWDEKHEEMKNILAVLPSIQNSEEIKDYTLSENIDDILGVSAHIFKINVDEIFVKSTIAPTTVYECTVTATLKSKPVGDDGNLMITMFNDTVEIGKEYIVLLSNGEKSAPVYRLSSRNSVYTPEEAAEIPQLKELLDNAESYTTLPPKTPEEILAEEQQYIEENS